MSVNKQENNREIIEDGGSGLSPSFRNNCLCLGFLVGTLIHFSSLGGSYLMTFKRDSTTDSALIWFSLLWSLATSSMGVLLLTTVRSLLGVSESVLINMEFLFTFGALGGVSVSWLIIDTLLGGKGQFQISVLTIVFTGLWLRIVATFLPSVGNNFVQSDDDLSTPLLTGDEKEGTDSKNEDAETMSTFQFRSLSLLCGCLVGLFIQFGSLGANFVMQQVVRGDSSKLLMYSLGWSFVCSIMGIGALLLIRNMMASAWPQQSFSFLLVIECFFAIGATLGLNAVWTMTDVVLGFQTHATENLLALLATMLWCKLILCCTASCELDDPENDPYDGDDEVSV